MLCVTGVYLRHNRHHFSHSALECKSSEHLLFLFLMHVSHCQSRRSIWVFSPVLLPLYTHSRIDQCQIVNISILLMAQIPVSLSLTAIQLSLHEPWSATTPPSAAASMAPWRSSTPSYSPTCRARPATDPFALSSCSHGHHLHPILDFFQWFRPFCTFGKILAYRSLLGKCLGMLWSLLHVNVNYLLREVHKPVSMKYSLQLFYTFFGVLVGGFGGIYRCKIFLP